jgi:hypothetical protein
LDETLVHCKQGSHTHADWNFEVFFRFKTLFFHY